jgi:hypothetical protein
MKILGLALIAAAFFAVGKYTYASKDGFGFFIPHVGGYHVSTLN